MNKNKIAQLGVTLTTICMLSTLSVIPVAGEPECQPFFWGQRGKNNWFISDVEIYFSYDKELIDEVYYSITKEGEPDWQLYEDVFYFGEEGSFLFLYKWVLKDGTEIHSGDFITLKIDKTPPTVETIKRVNQLKKLINITAKAEDTASGIAVVQFYLDGELQKNVTNEPYYYIYSWEGEKKPGDHEVQVLVYNTAGLSKNTSFHPINHPYYHIILGKLLQKIYALRHLIQQFFPLLISFSP